MEKAEKRLDGAQFFFYQGSNGSFTSPLGFKKNKEVQEKTDQNFTRNDLSTHQPFLFLAHFIANVSR